MERAELTYLGNELKSKKEKYQIYYIVAAAAVLSFMAYNDMSFLFQLFYVSFCVIGIAFGAYTPLFIKISVLYTSGYITLSNSFSLLIWAITIGPILIDYIMKQKCKIESNKLFLLTASAFVFLISCAFGIDSRYTSVIMQCLYILAFLCVASIKKTSQLRMIIYAFIISGVFVCFTSFSDLISGNAQWHGYGYRLTFNGNERDLANAMSVPVYYFMYKVFANLEDDELFPKSAVRHSKLLNALKLLPFIIILFLSYSRGNYLAIAVPLIYILLKKGNNSKKRIVITIFAVVLLMIGIYYVIGKLDIKIRYDEIVNYKSSRNIRIEIWKHYISKLFDNPIRLLIGFGPGDIKRLSVDTQFAGFYAHSAFFDYLFSYGILGFAICLFMTCKGFISAIKNKDIFLTGFSMLTIVMFLPYGTSDSLLFHLMLGISAINFSRNKTKDGKICTSDR